MPKNLSKEDKIKKEYQKLKKIFSQLDQNKLKVVENLIKNAAFMAVTLSDLQEIINQEGYTEDYQNGANQRGVKQSEHVKIHLAMQKNYTAVIDKLLEFVPEGKKAESKLEAFKKMGF